MDLYEFINRKSDAVKMNSKSISIVALVNAMTAIEKHGVRASEIAMSREKFDEFRRNLHRDPFEKSNSYSRAVSSMRVLGARIVIDDSIPHEIVTVRSGSREPYGTVEIFIGSGQ